MVFITNFSGRLFEVFVGRRLDPLWELLSRVAVVYFFESVLTVVFVVNMTNVWESVMASLRSQVFRRMLIQKVLRD